MGDERAMGAEVEALQRRAAEYRRRLAAGWSPGQPPILHEPGVRRAGPQCECHACVRLLLAWAGALP